VEGIWCHILAW